MLRPHLYRTAQDYPAFHRCAAPARSRRTLRKPGRYDWSGAWESPHFARLQHERTAHNLKVRKVTGRPGGQVPPFRITAVHLPMNLSAADAVRPEFMSDFLR